MSFNQYAKYYDIINTEKNYHNEIEFIHKLIQLKVPGAKKILEIGCGTGIHAGLLSNYGYEIVCTDISLEMILIAKEKNINNSLLKFFHSDILDFKCDEEFDVIISLFHVVSYFTENIYITNVFKNVNSLLRIDGYFIFDCWDGNGVLRDLPQHRLKSFKNEQIKIHRFSTPSIDLSRNLIDVKFKFIAIENHVDILEFEENHRLRYFFPVEINLLCSLTNFTETNIKDNLFSSDWYSLYACKKLKTLHF